MRLRALLLVCAAFAVVAACDDDAATDDDDKHSRADDDDDDGDDDDDAPTGDDDDAPAKDGGAKPVGPGEILGTLTGSCGTVKAEIAKKTPSLVHDELVFVAGERYVREELSPGGQTLFDTDNAGGSSVESEVMSFEVLHACEGADLVKTETKIQYVAPDDAGPNSITDILVGVDGKKVGVSVTRAYRPAAQGGFGDDDVKALLEKKLEGINRSSVRVKPEDKWVKQVLHVFAATTETRDAIDRVYPTLSADLRADTVVLVTTTKGGGFIYCKPVPALGSECP